MRILQNNGFKSVGSKALGFCLLVLVGLAFLACPADDPPPVDQVDFTVGAADFATVMKSISNRPGTYTVTLTEDVINYGGVTIIDGVKITVNGGA